MFLKKVCDAKTLSLRTSMQIKSVQTDQEFYNSKQLSETSQGT